MSNSLVFLTILVHLFHGLKMMVVLGILEMINTSTLASPLLLVQRSTVAVLYVSASVMALSSVKNWMTATFVCGDPGNHGVTAANPVMVVFEEDTDQ
jgi:hypothetical protein